MSNITVSSLFQSFLCADCQVEGVLGPGNGGRVHLWRWVMHEVTPCLCERCSQQTSELVQISKVSIHLTLGFQESMARFGGILGNTEVAMCLLAGRAHRRGW